MWTVETQTSPLWGKHPDIMWLRDLTGMTRSLPVIYKNDDGLRQHTCYDWGGRMGWASRQSVNGGGQSPGLTRRGGCRSAEGGSSEDDGEGNCGDLHGTQSRGCRRCLRCLRILCRDALQLRQTFYRPPGQQRKCPLPRVGGVFTVDTRH